LPQIVAVFLFVIPERKNLTPRPKSIHSQKSLVEAISQVPEEHQQACEVDETKEVLHPGEEPPDFRSEAMAAQLAGIAHNSARQETVPNHVRIACWQGSSCQSGIIPYLLRDASMNFLVASR
jgi:hypothetical protein